MSEKKDSTQDKSEATDAKAPADKPAEEKPVKPAVATSAKPSSSSKKKPAAKPAGKGSSAVGWLALLLVLAVIGAGGYGGKLLLDREAQFNQRLETVETSLIREDSGLAELTLEWEKRLALESAKREELAREYEGQLRDIESRLAMQRAELSRFGAVDRQDWLLAEAQYLLRLANQRLIMAQDVVAAKALLQSADSILREMDDVSLHPVRAAIAADLAAVRAVPQRDIQGMYLTLAALIGQVDRLVIFRMPDRIEAAPVEPAENWSERLQQGYEDALEKLSHYIVIRRRDVPIEALMDPQWEGLVRQNLRMLLEQAQVALLSGNQALFRESLERARHWLAEFFLSDEAAARALADEIAALQDKEIANTMPDISGSLAAVDAVMDGRMQRGGDE